MPGPLKKWLPEKRRAYIYRVLTAGAPILIAYGALDAQHTLLWVAFAGSLLGFGLASANTSTSTPDE